MSIWKAVAVAVMFAGLMAVLAGLPFIGNSTVQTLTQAPVFSQSITVPVNGSATIHFSLNGTEADYYMSETVKNGAVRSASLNRDDYARWVEGSFTPKWQYSQPTIGEGDAAYWDMQQNAPLERYHVYWNPDTPTEKDVTIKICEQTTQAATDYAALGAGVAMAVGGAVAGLAAAYTLGKKVLFTVVALSLIVFGAALATATMEQTLGEETAATFTLTVPANSTLSEPIHYNITGYYQLTLAGATGRLNATAVSEEDYTAYQAGELDVYIRPWQGSHYPLSGTTSYDDPDADMRLLLVNPESYSQNVTVTADHIWIKNADPTNNIVGAVLIGLAAAIFVVTFRRQLADFHRALEHQE